MLIRQTIRYLPAQLLSPAFQLLSMVVWTYFLPPAEMGSYVLITATQEFAYLIALSWFSVYALRFMPFERGRAERSAFLHTEAAVIFLSVAISLVAAVITVAIIDVTHLTWQTVLVVAFFFATRGINTHYSERARAQSNILAYTLLQILGPILGFGIGLALLTWWQPTSEALILAYGAAQFIANLVAAPMIGIAILPRRIEAAILRAAFAYGGPILILYGLGWIAENNFRYVVGHISGAAAFGLMAVGWGLGRRCASFGAMLVAAAAFPIAARLLNEGRRAEALQQLATNAALLIGVMAPTVVGIAMISTPATDLLIAEPYREMTKTILGLSALAAAIRFLHVHVSDQIFILEKRLSYAGIVDIVEIVAAVVLTTAGLLLFGPIGAVVGTALGSTAAAAVSMYLAMRRLDFVPPVLDIVKVMAATSVMALGLALVPTARSVTGLVLTILLGMGLYAIAILVAYGGEARTILRRRLDRRAQAAA
ncbi:MULTISPECIES: lipopolysaccharide biosynthesis protein [Kaistia]|uniref:Polysaccharide biosynthesis C-terminal domain-containing protein n=1 Tax=Kaistia nematophila TaxID=2994654 RepID=A0A9X3IML7_9HYPH|nr:polysaccharide biosynthesis C-terminal domain-containing protein [Kaistia nematophila]MCX5571022.1 polysaccharide biosynthesis C-terminal domain-containing protein [Kaistia nematophila]